MVLDQACEERVVLEALQEAGGADHLGAPVHARLDTEAALLGGARERLVPLPPGRIGRRRQRAQPLNPLARCEALESGESATREVFARYAERPPNRFASTDRHYLGPCRERVQ